MKTLKLIIGWIAIISLAACSKDKAISPSPTNQSPQAIPIPNGSFENWDSMYLPDNWKTNSCPLCLGPFIQDVVQRDAGAFTGTFAAKFIYNQVYAAWAENKFSISIHPSNLVAFIKCNLSGTDTVLIKISLLHNSAIVDSGRWTGTTFIGSYSQINIPITQNSTQADSAIIFIRGGQGIGFPSNGTEFLVDKLELY